jgi:hypothetical protein
MSNDALKPDIHAIQQAVVDVLTQVRDLMNYASKKLESSDGKERRYAEHAKSIENEITKVKNLELRMAIAAPMKAGKSTIINAIVGQDILPSRNAAMTTLPTEIVFSKDVTEPKLKLRYKLDPDSDDFVDIYSVLRRSWRRLQEQINTIGITQASKDIAEYPHLQDLLRHVGESPEIPFLSEVSGTEAIQKSLTDLNDLVRLCGILVPSDNPLMSLVSVPRIEVPFLDKNSGLKLDSVGKLVIVDTPGPNEAGELNLGNVVKIQLEASSIILLVLDYTQLNAEAAENVRSDVDKVSSIKGKENIYILINKIDQRRSKKDMTKEQVLEFVQNKFDIQGNSDRVFEISASRAAYASNFRNELRINPEIDDPQLMETSGMLASEAFGVTWEEQFQNADMERMQSVAEQIWNISGFANFLERAIAVLMAQAAPRTLMSAVNDVNARLLELQNNVNLQKGTFGEDISKLQGQIAELEKDLLKLSNCRNKLKKEIAILCQKLEEEFSDALLDIQNQAIEQLRKIFGRKEYDTSEASKKIKFGFIKFAGIFIGVDYQGSGEIKFSSLDEANKFVEAATASIKIIVNDLLSDARENAQYRIKQVRKKIDALLKNETRSVITQAQRRLEKQFNVVLNLPEILDNLLIEEEFNPDIQAQYRSREYTDYKTVKERRWYTLWLWEHERKVPFSKTEHFYIVSIEEISNTVDKSIATAIETVKHQVFTYLEEEFQSELNSYFDELDQFLKSYEESLQASIVIGKQSAEKQAERKAALDKISNDSAKLKEAVEKQKKHVGEILKSKQ